jgi:hypothetical protein
MTFLFLRTNSAGPSNRIEAPGGEVPMTIGGTSDVRQGRGAE